MVLRSFWRVVGVLICVGTCACSKDPPASHQMVVVPAGDFAMGADEGAKEEHPTHTVYLDAFYIDRCEVTNAQYEAFVQATGRAQTKYAADPKFNAPQQPVVGVTWFDAQEYCAWAGLRLPTEAEWEKAARGTDGRIYPWGRNIEGKHANYGNSGDAYDNGTTPVGFYPEGVSPYGVYDMAGNVWEWVADWYAPDYYASSPARNPQGPDKGATKVMKGGSWYLRSLHLRSAVRGKAGPKGTDHDIGFRCARDE